MIKNLKKPFFIISIVILLSILFVLYGLVVKKKPILELGEMMIYKEDLMAINNKVDDKKKLAILVEKRLQANVLDELSIGSNFEAKVTYLNKYHPKAISKEAFNSSKDLDQAYINALESITNKKLNDSEAHDKYMTEYLDLEAWKNYLEFIDISGMTNHLKEKVSVSYIDFQKERVELFNNQYIQQAGQRKICEIPEVNERLNAYVETKRKLRFKKNKFDKVKTERIKYSRCEEESKVWLKSFFEKNHKLHDEEYLGFENHLSFY